MPMNHEMADAEESYRRGYYQGTWDVIEAVLPLLKADAGEKLVKWHTDHVHKWRYGNKNTRGPDNRIAGAIIPPRQKLKLR
jgi:hypothetical protein